MIESPADRRALLVEGGEEFLISDGQGGAAIAVDDGAGGTRGPIGILSFEHQFVELEASVLSRDPVVIVPTEEIPGVESGWSVRTSEGDFNVYGPPRDDGLGMSILMLTRPRP